MKLAITRSAPGHDDCGVLSHSSMANEMPRTIAHTTPGKKRGSADRTKGNPLGKTPRKYHLIWETVSQIPKGRITTYGEIATLAGLPGQARLIGYALHNLPANTKVPWHRVINAQGKISLSNLDGMHDVQWQLLKKEGVRFFKERTSFSKYGWLQNLPKHLHRRS